MKWMPLIRNFAISTVVGGLVPAAFAESTGNVGATQSTPNASRLEVPAPRVREAVNGQLDLKVLAGGDAHVEFTYPSIATGHTVGMRWTGSTVYNATVQTVGPTRPLVFVIPNSTIVQSKGSQAVLTGSVGVNSNPLVISAPLAIQVKDTTGATTPGQAVADDLNARFYDTRASCDGGKPSYYCNGVAVRAMFYSSGWDPWDPSPSAQTDGSQSFSYLRTDANVRKLFSTTDLGIVLLSQNQAIAQGKALEYLCMYPHDAWTDRVGRPGLGCGLQPGGRRSATDQSTEKQPLVELLVAKPELAKLLQEKPDLLDRLRNGEDPSGLLANSPEQADLLAATPQLGPLLQEDKANRERWRNEANNARGVSRDPGQALADLSTCASKNAITLSTWTAYTNKLTQPYYQCSLSTQNAAQFDTGVKARNSIVPPNITYDWNELLIKAWPKGTPEKVPLQAFYYENSNGTGMSNARIWQFAYRKATGIWVPVILMNIAGHNGKTFFYRPEDQQILP